MAVTRTIEHVLERGESNDLKRTLRARDLVGFGVGIIIGTGILTLAGAEAKEHAGPALSFLIGAVVAGLAALCYAEPASSVPTAGSAYTYAFATLGEIFAWIIGWTCCWSSGSAWPRSPAAGRATWPTSTPPT